MLISYELCVFVHIICTFSCAHLIFICLLSHSSIKCDGCLDVLDARKKSFTADCSKDEEGKRQSVEAQLPPLPKLDSVTLAFAEKAQNRFREEMISRKELALGRFPKTSH